MLSRVVSRLKYKSLHSFCISRYSTKKESNIFSNIRFPFGQRTSVTNELWAARDMRVKMENKPVTSRSPAESILETNLPFSTNHDLRELYVSPFGHIRVGKILEDLDAMAASVSYMHADDGLSEAKNLTIVTASVDRIQLLDYLSDTYDYNIRGYITWVGKSSMEVKLELLAYKEPKEKPNEASVVLVAYFTLAARDPLTMRAAKVNRLEIQNETQQKLFDQGEQHKKNRLLFAEKLLTKSPPTPEESLAIHEIFMKQLEKTKKIEAMYLLSPSPISAPILLDDEIYIPMANTKQGTTILCQPQERNIHGKIFGGYLMRKGFELAFSSAYLFGKSLPFFFAMDDVTFCKPVEIGDILQLEATVTYTSRRDFSGNSMALKSGSVKSEMLKTVVETTKQSLQTFIHVEVVAYVTNPMQEKKHSTNSFNFTFICPEKQHECVVPQTYEEAMKYIEGKRRLERHLAFANSNSAVLMNKQK